MKSKGIFVLLLLAPVFLWSCQPEPDSAALLDQLVVSTNFDPNADFREYTTFAIPTDTIGFISNNSNDTIIVASKSSFPRPILAAIRSNIEARGYTCVDRTENPDLGVNVLVVNDLNVFQEVVYPGGYGYPGSYYSGYYGYGSWYYYPYINTYAYNTGVLVIEVVDLKNKTPDNKVRVVWDAYLGDIYNTLYDVKDQCVEGINQAFVQSPYFDKSGQ